MSALTLTIDRTSLSLSALVVTSDGTSAAELVAWDPGRIERQVDFARSRWLPGGFPVSSRDEIVATSLAVRLEAADADAVLAIADAWVTAFGQLNYTISEDTGTLVTVYECFPASVQVSRDPELLDVGIVVVTVSIPRQP